MMTDGAEGTPSGDVDSDGSQESMNKTIEHVLEELFCNGVLHDYYQPNSPRLTISAGRAGVNSSTTLGSFANGAAVCSVNTVNECESQSGQISLKYEPQVEATSPDSGYVFVHSNDSRKSNFDETTDGLNRPNYTHDTVSHKPIAMYEIPPLPAVVSPPRANLVGDHGFRIAFEQRDFVPKCVSYTYSPILNKLFVRMNLPCSVQFTCEYPPPPGTIIRAMLLYQNAEHVHEAVCRCQNHLFSDVENQNIAHHIMQVASHIQNTIYSSSRGRFCVSVPFEAPSLGVEAFAVQYKFKCFSTCIGGINRRPLVAVFTLETDQGQTLGRASVELKICSCPGRDRHKEEERRKKEDIKNHVGLSTTVPLPRKRPMTGNASTQFKLLRVREENFDILSKINDALNLASMATDQQKSEYDQEEQKHRWTEELAKFCKDNLT